MNTFDLVRRFVSQNSVKHIVIGSNMWNKLIKYVGTFYPDLDSEYYGNIMFLELYDLNITVSSPDE